MIAFGPTEEQDLIRQTVHEWLRRYAVDGLGGLADHSSRPLSCPHQMVPELEARIVEMRRAHPGWGPRTILFWLDRAGVAALPGRSSVRPGWGSGRGTRRSARRDRPEGPGGP